jgi:hypothetical protein
MQQTEEQEQRDTSGEQRQATKLRLPATKAASSIICIMVLLALAGTFVSGSGAIGAIALVIGLTVLIHIFLSATHMVVVRHHAVAEITWIERYRCPECGMLGASHVDLLHGVQVY